MWLAIATVLVVAIITAVWLATRRAETDGHPTEAESPGDGVPDEIEHRETVARRCDVKAAKGGKVKARAFYSTKWPFEISVDREAYCDPWQKIADNPKKTLVRLVVGDVRENVQDTRVVSSKPPPEHAHIESHVLPGGPKAYPHKKDVDVEGWAKHAELCTELANYAVPLDRPGEADE